MDNPVIHKLLTALLVGGSTGLALLIGSPLLWRYAAWQLKLRGLEQELTPLDKRRSLIGAGVMTLCLTIALFVVLLLRPDG